MAPPGTHVSSAKRIMARSLKSSRLGPEDSQETQPEAGRESTMNIEKEVLRRDTGR